MAPPLPLAAPLALWGWSAGATITETPLWIGPSDTAGERLSGSLLHPVSRLNNKLMSNWSRSHC